MRKPVVGITLPQNAGAGYERYFSAMEKAGAEPRALLGTGLEGIDALLFPGGGDLAWAKERYVEGDWAKEDLTGVDPERDERELALARAAAKGKKRILGVCRGMQVLCVALGGRLYADIGRALAITPEREPHPSFGGTDAEHGVLLRPNSLLYGWFGGQTRVNSSHHQAVGEPGAGLSITAVSPLGVIEAMEHENGRILLVQWHPERQAGMEPLFRWLAGKE